MVAVITGNGTGLERSSGLVLGSRGQLGNPALGRANDNVFVNGATGGLTIQNMDEMLIGLGPDARIARTYNSLGTLNDDNGDNWRAGVSRKVAGLTGTVNTAGSTITRTDWDGSETVYSWDTTKSAYVSREGAGAYDTLTFAGSTWTWKDGDSRVTELYDNNNGGRITSSADTDGNALSFSYNAGGLVSRVTTADGHYTDLTYSGTNLTQLTTSYRETAGGTLKTLTRVRYGYDGSNRLSTVTVDLTPTDNSVTDNVKYVTTYTYDGTSRRVASISQTDGSSLAIAYTLVGSDYRVSSLTQTSAMSVTRVTSFSYNTATRTTTITDPSSQVTTLTYDTSGQLLTVVAPPAVSGGTSQTSTFTYNANGDVLTTADPSGRTITYDYDSNGNCISQRDTAGNVVTRTFGSNNELLTETRYLVPDPDGGTLTATVPVTTRYAYDSENHLRFAVSAEGYITEFVYNAGGQQTSVIQYAGNAYNITFLATTASISESTLASWVSGISDKSTAKRTDTTYNFRGDIATVTSYGKTQTSGAGDTTATTEITKVNYVYDQASNLLSRQLDGASTSETYVYDGLNRITSAVDSRGLTTTVTFNDASSITTVATSGSGVATITRTSTYNLAGELISYAQSASGMTTATTSYRYDAMGRLRGVTDPLGVKTYVLYDRVGRKVADVQADGQITEYGYNADNLLIKTVHYKTLLSSTLLTQLDNNTINFTYELSAYRPSSDAADIWEWRVYDNAHRLIETIDGAGAATVLEYDGASRLVRTTAYANLIAAATVTTYKTTPPSTLATPLADGANDRTTRYFYDDDGRLEYRFDASGYLTKSIYDSAGQLVETIAYADVGDLSASSLAAIISSVTVNNDNDIHNWYLYDKRGYLLTTIDGEGDVVLYSYTALGHVSLETRGQKLTPSQLAVLFTTPPTLGTLPAAEVGTVMEVRAFTRDNYGKVLTETRTLAGGATETDTYTYDTYGRLLKLVTLSGASDTRAATYRYDAFGRLTGQLSGEGSAALAALGGSPTQTQIDDIYARWGTQYSYDQDDRLIAQVESNGTDAAGLKALFYYDVDGQLTHTINALGEVIEYRYDAFGRRTDVIAYGTRIGSTPLATLTGGLVNSTLTSAITTIANSALDSRTQLGYNVTGTVSASTDAEGAVTTFGYNAFRDLTTQLDPISSGVTRQITRAYDRKGLLLSTTVDAAGVNIINSATYDAFGRVITTTDGDGKVRSTGYDRAGRVLTTTDPLNGVTTYTYDGRGAVLTVKDRVNSTATTTFTYTAFNRTVTMTTPEGLVTTTTSNAYGQSLTVTDGAGRTVTFTYDKDGALKTQADGLGSQIQNSYDKAGRLSFTLDQRGYKTSFTYDGASRVLTRKVDDGGLNLTTSYEWDAQGRQTKVTDAAGRVSTVAFDRNGRTTTVTVDPAGLAIATKYAYDQIGRTTTVTEAFGSSAARVTQYTYDKADRLTSSQVDPTGLNLTTTYAYDKRGNVVARVDASGARTRFVYDNDNRLIWTVDAAGDVTQTSYDAEGRVIATLGYANKVAGATLTTWGTTPLTETMVTSAVSTSSNDHKTRYVYDKDGRQTHAVAGNGAVTAFTYDGSGNVIQTTQYNALYTAGGAPSLASMTSWIGANASAANDRTNRTVYDAAGRAVFQIRPEKYNTATSTQSDYVTQVQYDAAGNAISVTRYAASYTTSGAPSASAMATWVTANASAANDRTSRTIYDGAGRVAFQIEPERYASGVQYDYVTEIRYDAGGNPTKLIQYAASYTTSGTPTLSGMASWVSSNADATNDRVSRTVYDGAGRAVYAVDAESYVTQTSYDALGNATKVIRYAATYTVSDSVTQSSLSSQIGSEPASAVVTAYGYDAAGRMTSQVRGYGTAYAATTSYTLDGMGRATVVTNPRGYTTTRTYNAAGQVLTETVQLASGVNAVTTNQYDAFGNLVKVTDARGNVGYFYYNALNQLTRQVDPENYVTDTTYSLGGEALTVKRFYNRATSGLGSVTTPPADPTANAKDATTTITRDKLDRVTATTDAEGFSETYTLNAFGDRITVVGKLGGSTTNTFDKRGLLVAEVLPISSTTANGTVQATSVTNKYEYDAFGNRTKATEAFGLTEARVTTFTYDKLDRLTQEIGDQVQVLATDLTTTSNVTPIQTITYDSFGNIIQSKDAANVRTVYAYDEIGRKVGQIDALGTYSVWTYDLADNMVSARIYGDAVTQPAAGAAFPAPVNSSNYRETTYAYDRNNRLISTSVASLRTGAWNGTSYATSVATVTTQRVYDAMGNVVQETDGLGNNVFHFYDKRGREAARVDQENYLTSYTLDAEGNVTKEERFATRITGTVTASSDPAALRTGVVSGSLAANNRVTDFTYDRVGQRLTESRSGVVAYIIDVSTGLLSTASTTATITYTYNGLGEVTRKTEANGDYTDYTYDDLGRQLTATDSAFTDYTGVSVQHRTDTFYDGLNNVTRMREGKIATDSAIDRVTSFTYGAGGRLASTTDALGNTRTYAYDAVGHVVKEGYTRLKSDGTTTLTEAVTYQYDVLGRTILQANASWGGSAWTYGDKTHIRYNVFGEVTGKGMTAGSASTPVYQETFEYDAGGRMWRSNTGDGSFRLYLYDAAGHLTLAVNSTGTDLSSSSYASLEAAITGLGATNIAGGAYLAGIAPTISVYDKRGQTIQTRQPNRELTVVGSSTATLTQSRAYNAFGEVVQETDARNNITDYSYNALGKLDKKKSPYVHYTLENGADIFNSSDADRPNENYYYDLSGRLIGVKDANGNLNTRALLAGSGHGEEEAIVIAEFRAGATDSLRSGTYSTGVDVFGDVRKLTNELGFIETRDYDKAGQLITLTRPTRSATATTLVEHYTYDSLGHRLTHWNSQLGTNNREKTDYDLQGRIVRSESFGDDFTIVGGVAVYSGDATTYAYAWNASLVTTGLGAYGGVVTTTTHVSGRTSTDSTDYFGREVDHVNYGGYDYAFTFDKAGRLIQKTSNFGQKLDYTYFNTGNLATLTDHLGVTGAWVSQAVYAYDESGNRTAEKFTDTVYSTYRYLDGETHQWVEEDTSGLYVHQDAHVTYDALNRMITYTDTGSVGGTVTASYEYDAVGNMRHAATTYPLLVGSGTATQDYWYKYDSMNRFVTTKGVFTGTRGSGSITRGTQGLDIAYDAAGQRVSATNSPTTTTSHREDYVYSEDGYLSQVKMADATWNGTAWVWPGSTTLRATDTRDEMGRVTTHAEYKSDGTSLAFSRTATYNNRSLVTADSTVLKQADGKWFYADTSYVYTAQNTPGTGAFVYQGGAVVSQTTTSHTTNASGGSYTNKPTTSTTNSYFWLDSAHLSLISYKPNTSQSTTFTSTFHYDTRERITSVDIADGRPRTVKFSLNADNQVLERIETSAASTNPRDVYYYFAGVKVGDNSNNGTSETDYATAIANRSVVSGTGAFRFGATSGTQFADFDQSYQAVNPNGTSPTNTTYTVTEGETLQTVAAAVWGDASLWYLIADANGLTSVDSLATGMSLVIPNKVTNVHNTSETFRPYDPNKAIGDTSPTTPKPPPKKGCGVLGQIIMVVVAVLVAIYLPPLLTSLGPIAPVVTAAAASVASQAVGVAIGAIDKFSWNAVALAALTAGVGDGGISTAFKSVENAFIQGALRGVAANVISQGIGVATGLQDRFDWTSVAVAGVVGGVTNWAGEAMARADAQAAVKADPGAYDTGELSQLKPVQLAMASRANTAWGINGQLNFAVSGTAGAIAGAAARSLAEGSDFGDNLVAALPDVIGATIGRMVVGELAAAERSTSSVKDGSDPIGDLIDQYATTDGGANVVAHAMQGAGNALDDIGQNNAPHGPQSIRLGSLSGKDLDGLLTEIGAPSGTPLLGQTLPARGEAYLDTTVVGGAAAWVQEINRGLGRELNSGGDVVLSNLTDQPQAAGIVQNRKDGVLTWTLKRAGAKDYSFTPVPGETFYDEGKTISVYVPDPNENFVDLRSAQAYQKALGDYFQEQNQLMALPIRIAVGGIAGAAQMGADAMDGRLEGPVLPWRAGGMFGPSRPMPQRGTAVPVTPPPPPNFRGGSSITGGGITTSPVARGTPVQLRGIGNPTTGAAEGAGGALLRTEVRNGYTYTLDGMARATRIEGDLVSNATQGRNSAAQLRAGGADRLATDEGGHFIGRRFDGPMDDFNHFAQDMNLNRSAYKSMENSWQRALDRGSSVNFEITPHYTGSSLRPSSLDVSYTIDGVPFQKSFVNRAGGR